MALKKPWVRLHITLSFLSHRQSARSAIQVCQLFRSIVEFLGNRTLKDLVHFFSSKLNYGVDFQTHSRLEGREKIAEYRGILVGSNTPPSLIESVSPGRTKVTSTRRRSRLWVLRYENFRAARIYRKLKH